MISSAFSFLIILTGTFSMICEAGVAPRNEPYGPRYKPLWEKDAKTKYSANFGPAGIKYLIEDAGFVYENYTLRTEDNYLININRMIHPDNVGKRDKGYPLLVLNGFMVQSEEWLIQPMMDSNLAPVWSALGYDVWLGDQRGTMRSKGHVTLNAERDAEYWDHATDEIGVYDTATFIDFVLRKTGYKDLVLICVSFGCSFHGALIDARPEYNDKIKGAFYFVPLVNNIAKQTQMTFAYRLMIVATEFIIKAFEHSGIDETKAPRLRDMKKEVFHLCSPFKDLIIPINKLIYYGSSHIARTMCSQTALAAAGASIKSAKHILQMYNEGEFVKYDFGREENMKRYGQVYPPRYNMTKITSFVAIYYSDGDGFSSLEGVQRTLRSLGGPTYQCLIPGFSHFDIVTGDTTKYVIPDMTAVLDSLTGYSNNTEKAKSGKCPSMEWVRYLNY